MKNRLLRVQFSIREISNSGKISYATAGILATGLAYAIITLVLHPRWTVDDAYIAFRYAANLANHGELTWNVGEDPVEGYTGILLPLLLAAAIAIDWSPVLASQAIGIFGYLSGGFLLFLLLRNLSVSGPLAGGVALIYYTAPFMAIHSFSGLETLLFGSALLFCLLLYPLILQNPVRKSLWMLLLIALLFVGLVRPEGALLAVLTLLGIGYTLLRNKEEQGQRYWLLILVGFAVLGSSYFIWRYTYYGQLLPNTFYVKRGQGWDLRSIKEIFVFGKKYVAIHLVVGSGATLTGCLANKLWVKGKKRPFSLKEGVILCVAIGFASIVLVQYSRSRLAMNYSYRFFAPLYAMSLLVSGIFLSSGLRSIEAVFQKGWHRRGVRGLSIGLLVTIAFLNSMDYVKTHKNNYQYVNNYKSVLKNQHIEAGKYLNEIIPKDEWLVVCIDAGAIPYYSGLKTVDLGKLNDEKLARTALSQEEVVEYVFEHRPGAIVITSYTWHKLKRPGIGNALVKDTRFDDYTLAKKYRSPDEDGYYQFVYIRSDLLTQGVGKPQASFGQTVEQ